jgi:hypothetical protein
MPSMLERSNRLLALIAALTLLAAPACGDDGTPPEPEPEVTTIRIEVGTTFSVDVPHPNPCDGTNTAVPLRVNQANRVSFRFLGANGQDEPIIIAERANLELDMANTTGWTFTSIGGTGATFTADITPTATGSFIPRLELRNTEHGHNEVECVIRFTVTS